MTSLRNGINIEVLARLGDDAFAHMNAVVHTTWQGAVESRSVVVREQNPPREHAVTTDLQPHLLGADAGPTPVELMLASFGGQFVSAYVLEAAREGVVLDSLEVQTTATREADGVALSVAAQVISSARDADVRAIGERAVGSAWAMQIPHRPAPSFQLTVQKPAFERDVSRADRTIEALEDTREHRRRA